MTRLAKLAVCVTFGLVASGCSADTDVAAPGINVSSTRSIASQAAPAKGGSVLVTMAGQLSAAPQTLNGRNDASSIVATGTYTLTIGLDLATLQCPEKPGAIPWEAGLVAFVQNSTPRSGTLDINYTKPSGDANRVDFWKTQIGTYSYQFQFFRWSSAASSANPDGSTTVLFRDGSVEVFKKKNGRTVSREQCFGAYLDYDLTAR